MQADVEATLNRETDLRVSDCFSLRDWLK